MKKMINRYISAFSVFFALLFCVTIILVVYVICDIKGDRKREYSFSDLFATEMYNSANNLYVALNSEDETAAYHYSKSAEEYAYRSGLQKEGALFSEIAFTIKNGESVSSTAREALVQYLSTGRLLAFSADGGTMTRGTEICSEKEVPLFIAELTAKNAKRSAERLIGVKDVLHLCEKNTAGEYLFTCRNAYAVIDEKTGIPIEASVSLEMGEGDIGEERAASIAYDFLGKIYPKKTVLTAAVEEVRKNDSCGTYDIVFKIDDSRTALSLKADSGKAVRFLLG